MDNPAAQADVKEICRQDILFWVNCFAYTKDPRREPDILPFITYDAYQDEYILEIKRAVRDQYDILTDKSRDMGVSWMVLYVFTHEWLFETGAEFRVGSRKEEYVDKLNDIDTLLEKIRFNLSKQPLWMLPKGYKHEEHASYMRIRNPENGNVIIGESANAHFGSGGRRRALLLDEYAKWEDSIAEAAWTATADVTRCRIVVSTPVGSANKFAQLALGTHEKIKKVSLHWTLHPEKSAGAYYIDDGIKIPIADSKAAFKIWQSGVRVRSPWYDAEAERRKEADLAQEVDIDYLRSGFPFFDIKAIAKQKAWEYYQRPVGVNAIPYGKYITATMVDIDHKIELREIAGGWLRLYELPKENYQYVVSADIAEGLEKGDESFLVVREKITRNVVAAANGKYKTDDFAVKVQMVGKFYNVADVAPENNNHGHSVCEDLKLMDCKLYWSKRVSPDGSEHTTKAGWTTDLRSRPAMLDQFEEEIRKSIIELRDKVLIDQCKTFVNNPKNGRPEADGSFLDDGVLACAIGSAVIKELPFKPKAQSEHRLKQAQAVKEMKRPIAVFGGV